MNRWFVVEDLEWLRLREVVWGTDGRLMLYLWFNSGQCRLGN